MTQDALVLAWRQLPRLRDPERFEAWLRRILVNRCRDLGRARGRRVHLIRVGSKDQAASATDPRPGVEQETDLAAAVASLPIDHRTVLALHYAADLTIAEVAATLGVPVGTAKSRLNAALAGIRRSLGDMDR